MINDAVLILMATYNGEKYLTDQLESIINQTNKNWKLIVQNDGSDDSILNILKSYQKKDGRIEIWINDSGLHGPYMNFYRLINKVKKLKIEYGYYAFADQDDVWENNKLDVLLNEINGDIPTLIYSDMRIIDANGKVTNTSITNTLGLRMSNSISAFFVHQVFGCAAVVNNALFSIVPTINLNRSQSKILAHDNLYAKFAATYGKVAFCPKVLVNYRRYGNNVTSKYEYNFKLSRILRRVMALNKLAADHARTYSQSLEAIRYMEKLDRRKLIDTKEVSRVINKGGISSVRYVLRKNIHWGNPVKDLSHILIICTGIYKKYLV